MKVRITIAACAVAALASGTLHAQSTLDAVKAKGYVQCGVNTGLAGFSQPDSRGVWKGLDVISITDHDEIAGSLKALDDFFYESSLLETSEELRSFTER
jgi:ABC-type amino acid transport substrate-binding protein